MEIFRVSRISFCSLIADLKDEIFEGDLQKGEKESSEEAKDYFYAGERAFKARK